MKTLPIALFVSVCAGNSAAHANDAPLALKMSGFVEAGGSSYELTGDYPNRHTAYVRGALRRGPDQQWFGEVARITEFGDSGTLLALQHQRNLDETWLVQVAGATSIGGATLPRLRLDFSLGRKWLEQKNLVTTLGVSGIQAKDIHRDRAVQLSAAYYFDAGTVPMAAEGGVRYNISDPGAVAASSYFLALTRGSEKDSVISLRLSAGREAYQLIGSAVTLTDFPSRSWLLTWRKWLNRDSGFQLRLDGYHNPYYDRRGVEAGWFRDF